MRTSRLVTCSRLNITEKDMKQIIIYASLHGAAKRYAERLAEITGIEAKSFKEVKDLAQFERIIYVGAIYAGGVMGLKNTAQEFKSGQEVIIATVGMTDPTDPVFVSNIRGAIRQLVSADICSDDRIFHLRGAIDYAKLGLGHRILMKMMYSQATKTPEDKLTAEAKAIKETYGQAVDYVNFDTLNPVVEKCTIGA